MQRSLMSRRFRVTGAGAADSIGRRGGARLVAVVVLSVVAGCSGLERRTAQTFEVRESDYAVIADASLKFIEHDGPISAIVAGEELNAPARAALARLRPLVAPNQVPVSAELLLPAGYLRVRRFEIADGMAAFEGEVGPIHSVPVPPATDDCGTRFEIPFALEEGGWASHTLKKSTCWPKRVWWPKDEPQPVDKVS